MTIRSTLGLATVALALSACGQQQPPEAPAPEASQPAASAAPAAAAITRKAAPAGAVAYLIEPADGATVSSPVRVAFGLRGAGVAPAGVDLPNTGHHHLLIDTRLASFDQPIPADAQHVHFGLGQTETTVELAPGRHELQLVLGDNLHVPHDPPILSAVVTIEVRN
ncbi:MAG TPA: DUF4399 domain-containing protein [Gammaproteobacteria bacterium]|nr:DUF4399 domain-containing protein [Gammaproteobacteria bacterium]